MDMNTNDCNGHVCADDEDFAMVRHDDCGGLQCWVQVMSSEDGSREATAEDCHFDMPLTVNCSPINIEDDWN